MEDNSKKEEILPLVQGEQGEVLKFLLQKKEENIFILENISRFSIILSIILFFSLTIICSISRHLDPTSVVIGYWMALLLLCGSYIIRKKIKRSNVTPRLLGDYWCSDEDVKKFITSLIKFKTDKEVCEALRQRRFLPLGSLITFFGCMVCAGIITMEMYLGYSNQYEFPLKLSYSIWVILQGLAIVLTSRWCAKRKMIMFTIVSCVACLTVTIYILCTPYVHVIKSRLEKMLVFDTYRHSEQVLKTLETAKLIWPRNNENKLEYPNVPSLVSICLQNGPLVPLAAFLAFSIVCYILSLFELWPRSSGISILPVTKNHWSKKWKKWTFRTMGTVFISGGFFVVFSGHVIDGIAPITFSSSWEDGWVLWKYIVNGYLLCSILTIVGTSAIIYSSKSRSTTSTTTLLVLMVGVFSVGIYFLLFYTHVRNDTHSYSEKILTWNQIRQNIHDANCERNLMPNASEHMKDNMYSQCIFLCKRVEEWKDGLKEKNTTCEPLCFHQDDFCNGVFDYAANVTLAFGYGYVNSQYKNNYLSYCNETGQNYRSYSNEIRNEKGILLADEINCSAYEELYDASLTVNIVISGVMVIVSSIAISILWISANLSNLVYAFFAKMTPSSDFKDTDITQSVNIDPDVAM